MKSIYQYYLIPFLVGIALLIGFTLDTSKQSRPSLFAYACSLCLIFSLLRRYRFDSLFSSKVLLLIRRDFSIKTYIKQYYSISIYSIVDSTKRRYSMLSVALVVVLGLMQHALNAQTETIASGSFIVNMGVVPQTIGNGLKPYGMIYDLTKNYNVPVKWVINTAKAKDGVDFTHAGVDYKGGTFIIPAEFRTATVNTRITFWQGQGVVGGTTTSPVTVPVYATIGAALRWTLDQDNGDIAKDFFTNAGIPATAYDMALPSALGCCNDIFVMPHADPTWATHGNLLPWNLNCKGAIWLGCHAGSALEDMFNPASPSSQTNFLANKTGTATGGGPYSENALVLWTNHSAGTLPYSYDYSGEPVMQFMGILDAATQNGSEQIYITKSPGWRTTTHVGVYDPDNVQKPSNALEHRAAIVAYGPGLGDSNRGWVMMQASHDIAKATATANVAAQRAFFNFCMLTAIQRTVQPDISSIPASLPAGVGTQISYTLPVGINPANYTTQWTSSCGGTFSPNATSNPVTYTPPANATSCVLTVKISDACGRSFFASKTVSASCPLSVARTVSGVSCNGGTNGAINMTISGASAPYNWNWSRVSPAGTGSGTGTTISGLSPGTYNVTVTTTSGCFATFSSLVTQPNTITATTNVVNAGCFGQTGAVNLTVTGGTPAYTYSWAGPAAFTATTQNLSNVAAGTYTVTVTDANSCTQTASATVGAPAAALSVTLTSQTNINCNGGSNGAINITAAGGTAPYTYNWGGGITTEDRTGLTAGTYIVTVTDNNGCTATSSVTITQPAALTLTTTKVNPSCPSGATPPLSSNGTIDLTVSGGTATFTYAWTTVGGSGLTPATQDQSGLTAGTYNVTVTDANGCTATTSVTLVNQNPNPVQPGTINNN